MTSQNGTTGITAEIVDPSPAMNSVSTVVIAVSVVAGILLLCVLGLMAVLFIRRRKKKTQMDSSPTDSQVLGTQSKRLLPLNRASRFSTNMKVELEEEIGRGNFSIVYRGKLKDGTFVCVKMIKENVTDQMKHEFLIASDLNHPNIVQYLGDFMMEESYFMVTEYMNSKDLRLYIQENAETLTSSDLIDM